MCGWPHSLLDWDLLFLLPLPWWGPVLAPVLIALLMIAWGTLTCQIERSRASCRSDVTAWGMNLIGTGLALYVFMADTIRVANQGVEALRNVLPAQFNWPLFSIALLLMAAPVFQAYQQISQRIKTNQREQ
jgi:predicted metal-binding membrane protein